MAGISVLPGLTRELVACAAANVEPELAMPPATVNIGWLQLGVATKQLDPPLLGGLATANAGYAVPPTNEVEK